MAPKERPPIPTNSPFQLRGAPRVDVLGQPGPDDGGVAPAAEAPAPPRADPTGWGEATGDHVAQMPVAGEVGEDPREIRCVIEDRRSSDAEEPADSQGVETTMDVDVVPLSVFNDLRRQFKPRAAPPSRPSLTPLQVADGIPMAADASPFELSDRRPVDSPAHRVGAVPEVSWESCQRQLKELFQEMRCGFANPFERTTLLDGFAPFMGMLDDTARLIFEARLKDAFTRHGKQPQINQRFMTRDVGKFYSRTLDVATKALGRERDKIEADALQELYQSPTRTGAFRSLLEYAELSEEDIRHGDQRLYYKDGSYEDTKRFSLTSSGFAKVERMTDSTSRLNLANIGNVLKMNGPEVEEGPQNGLNVLFLLYGDKEKLSRAESAHQGGFVLGCQFRGPFFGDDGKVDHLWEVEARHCTPALMNVATARFRGGLEEIFGNITPLYRSPLAMIGYAPEALREAYTLGELDALAGTVGQFSDVVETVQEYGKAIDQQQELVRQRLGSIASGHQRRGVGGPRQGPVPVRRPGQY